MFTLPVTIQNTEYIAVSCPKCKDIRLWDIQTGEVRIAFDDPRYYPRLACQGNPGKMFVVHSVNGFPTMQLNCSQVPFTLDRVIQRGMEQITAMCFVPNENVIVVSNFRKGLIRAVSCDTEKIVWELKGKIQGVKCNPHGMVFSSRGPQALLVADGKNHRLLVVNSGDGSVRQVVPLDQVSTAVDLCVYNQKVIVLHFEAGKAKISFFSIQ